VGLVVAVGIAAVCVRLGFWQLHRLHERGARNAEIRAAREQPPLEAGVGLTADVVVNRRLHARGVYDYAHERVWRARTYEGVPGVALVTPLRLRDGPAVFVDRGWVPSPDAVHVDQEAYREPDTADVHGLAFRAPRGRGDVNPATLADSLGYRVLPFVIQLLPDTERTVRPSDGPTVRPMRWPLPRLDRGPHLSYAIQWFSFALIILVGSVALFGRGRDRGRERGEG
jgi:surfeit locus 1 family protein